MIPFWFHYDSMMVPWWSHHDSSTELCPYIQSHSSSNQAVIGRVDSEAYTGWWFAFLCCSLITSLFCQRMEACSCCISGYHEGTPIMYHRWQVHGRLLHPPPRRRFIWCYQPTLLVGISLQQHTRSSRSLIIIPSNTPKCWQSSIRFGQQLPSIS